MKRLISIALLTLPFWAAGQGNPQKPLPEYTYITPQMSRHQLDSVMIVLKRYSLSMGFDTVIYDAHKRIKEVKGSLDTQDEYFPLVTSNFKGITIISRGDSITVIMGLLHPPPKK
jgi:hypothetical protein